MMNEPITLFARVADPAAVARLLRDRVPGAEIVGPDNAWESAVVSFPGPNGSRTLTFTHDPAYYAEPNWSRQMSGMRGYLDRFPDTARKSQALLLTTSFRFSLGTLFDPEVELDTDPRLGVLVMVALALDGILFTPSGLRDAQGRVLFSGDPAAEDAAAEWPRVRGEASLADPVGAAMHERSRPSSLDQEPVKGAEPPDAARVARRALALTALTARAILEQDTANREARGTYTDLTRWVKDAGFRDEFEPDELEVVRQPLGKLAPQQQVNATWRLEGLVVLAWALGRFKLPPHDALVQLNPLWRSLGLLDAKAARALVASPSLRPRQEIGALRHRLFALHWRLRNFHLRPAPMDFAEFARTCWFGPLDLTGLPLEGGDLAVGGKRLDQADPNAVQTAHSAAQERHQAVNWLWEGPGTYSDASVAT